MLCVNVSMSVCEHVCVECVCECLHGWEYVGVCVCVSAC